jgi:uridine phosphorylase
MDKPILTPEKVLSLRGVRPESFRFDTAVLCFRGSRACDLLCRSFEADRQDGLYLYGTQPYIGGTEAQLLIVPNVIYGGPVTAALLEELALFGVETVIGFGAAGSLVSSHHVGGLLIAHAALCRDGTSREYTDDEMSYPDPGLVRLATELVEHRGVSPLLGTVHTTDALYRETPAKVRQWRRWGAEFVNLEAGPFFAVASHLGMRSLYLGLVTDYVAADRDWEHGFWNRENRTDPTIVEVIGELIERQRTAAE